MPPTTKTQYYGEVKGVNPDQFKDSLQQLVESIKKSQNFTFVEVHQIVPLAEYGHYFIVFNVYKQEQAR